MEARNESSPRHRWASGQSCNRRTRHYARLGLLACSPAPRQAHQAPIHPGRLARLQHRPDHLVVIRRVLRCGVRRGQAPRHRARARPDEGLVGWDLDSCFEPNGGLQPSALAIARRLRSYSEVTPSGTGVRIFVHADLPVDGAKKHRLEVYKAKRYLTITGDHLEGVPLAIKRRPKATAELYAEHFGETESASSRRPRAAAMHPGIPMPEPLAEEHVQALARKYPQLRAILQGTYPSPSEQDLAIVRFCKLARWEPEFAWALVRTIRDDVKADRPDYAALTLGRVY
jgi:hypothetical protein